MKTVVISSLLMLASLGSFAQSASPLAADPLYWANRKPYADYWQQDVHYRISADVDETTDIITGHLSLSYWNNSPDTLHEVFLHLYQNAFQPKSYLNQLESAHGAHHSFGQYEAQGLGTVVDRFTYNGQVVQLQLDNTIARVKLATPLLPHSKAEFTALFRTFFDQGSMGRRMKRMDSNGHTHYDGVHWYPRLAVYDAKFGWDTQQHLDHEFYGDFGSFDVSLSFASNYIVEATGVLQNRDDVLPKALRDAIEISKFKNKPWGEPASEVVPYDVNQRKTWRYHADHVHDFAFTADPTYRMAEAWVNGVQCVALVREPHASGWQNAANYTARTIAAFSRRIGPYHYPKMVVADADDGMEYPMLTLDGDSDPEYRGLLIHEIGHNWFYGQVGSNETYRASLDEGFTEYLTALGLRELEGDTMPLYAENIIERLFKRPQRPIDTEAHDGYMRSAVEHRAPALNTHSDAFGPDYRNGYVHVYYKTATMLYNLEYVLGDTLFANAFKDYFTRWKFCHPYPEDFRSSIIRYTKVDLNWFFDEWMEKTSSIDYSIGRIRGLGQDRYSIRINRKGDLHMPLDVRIKGKNDSIYNFYIPNTWFNKATTATILPKWYAIDEVGRQYTMEVTIPEGIAQVDIDTTHRLADIYMPNNVARGPIGVRFDSYLEQDADWKRYELLARPSIWYNGYDGLKFGVSLSGGHMDVNHVFNFRMWANSGLGQYGVNDGFKNTHQDISFMFDYRTSLSRWFKQTDFLFDARGIDGLYGGSIGFVKRSKSEQTSLKVYYKAMYRHDVRDMQYLLRQGLWETGVMNNSLNVELRHQYDYRLGRGEIQADLRSSAIGSGADFHRLRLSVVNRTRLWRLMLNTRLFGQLGTGSLVPRESALYLDGADPETLSDDPYTRSYGFFPKSWGTYGAVPNHFHGGGGLNLRGYAGYLAPFTDGDGNTTLMYAGASGAAINAELEFNGIFGEGPRAVREYIGIATYLFADAGVLGSTINLNKTTFSLPRMDAGVGIALTIRKWGWFTKAKPLTIRFDMPVYLSRTPALQPNNWDFRWVLGIKRAF